MHCLTRAGGEVDTHFVWGSDVRGSLYVTVSMSILKHVLNTLLRGIDLLVLFLRFDIPPLVCCVRMAAGWTAISASTLYGLISVQLLSPHLWCLSAVLLLAPVFCCKMRALGMVFCALTRLLVLACPRVILRLRRNCGV